tara:strand:+ start:268 stop:438 length:171 start_codon:yes stop_codon:yes gene_type:complete
MAYEALNKRLIVILNDNKMSIAPPGGRNVELSVKAFCQAQVSRYKSADGNFTAIVA